MLTGLLESAQTELDNNHLSAHDFVMLKWSLEDQRSEDNKALEKAKSENTEFTAATAAEKADLAEAEKRLASLRRLRLPASASGN